MIQLLNKVRVGNIDTDAETLLKSRFIQSTDPDYPFDALHIFAENVPAKDYNDMMLSKIKKPLVSIQALDKLPKNCKVSNSDMQSAQNRKQSESGGLALQLKLKIDARVMLTMNVDIEDRLINGQVGTVNHFRKNQHNQITIVYVKFDDEKAGVKKMNSDHFAKTNKCVPIEKSETSINLQRNRPLSPAIHRTQFPLMLSWACTVQNTRSLRRHAIDIASDTHLLTDILCLTETQLLPDHDIMDMEDTLKAYAISYNTHEDKYRSIAVLYKDDAVLLVNHERHPGVSIITIRKSSFSPNSVTLALIYRQSGSPICDFYNKLTQFIRCTDIDILLGDFNIDALDPRNITLSNILQDYELVVKEPTHLDGALLDHLHLKKNF